MKSVNIICGVIALLIVTFAPARADNLFYLPLVMTNQLRHERTAQVVDYTVERTQLWHVMASDGGSTSIASTECRQQHLVQIQVVNTAGGETLPGMVIAIEHDNHGAITTGLVTTQADGLVKVALTDGATLRIVKDTAGQAVTSQVVTMSTISSQVFARSLLGGSYCSGDANCHEFIVSNGCQEVFSWGIVFRAN